MYCCSHIELIEITAPYMLLGNLDQHLYLLFVVLKIAEFHHYLQNNLNFDFASYVGTVLLSPVPLVVSHSCANS